MEFKTGQKYGYVLTIEIVKRTAKTITIKSTFGEARVKVRQHANGLEYISFKAWLIDATELFNKEEAQKIALEKAYYL